MRSVPPPAEPAGGADPAVIWVRPASRADSARLEPWRAAVGPPVFQPRSPRRRAWPEDRGLRVVAWNTHVGAGDVIEFVENELGVGCDDRPPKPVIGPGIATGPFVLLIQEAFRKSDQLPTVADGPGVVPAIDARPEDGDRVDVESLARRCGLSLLYVPSMRNGAENGAGAEDRGNAVLSTLDLESPAAIELPFEAQRRVAVAATVRGPEGTPLLLVSLHFDVAAPLMRTLRTGNATRARQGLGLLGALAVLPDSGSASLIGGDFNTWSESETVIQWMSEAFPDSPPAEGEPTRGAFPADHIFFRSVGSGITLDTTRYLTYDDAHSSDHKARGVVLCFCDVAEPQAHRPE